MVLTEPASAYERHNRIDDQIDRGELDPIIDGLTDEQITDATNLVKRQPDADALLEMLGLIEKPEPVVETKPEEEPMKTKFTDEEKNRMVAMRLSSATYREIGVELGTAPSIVKAEIKDWIIRWTSGPMD